MCFSRFISKYTHFQEHIVRNFLSTDGGYSPFDYEKILKDNYYYSLIKNLQDGRMGKIRRTNGSIQNMKEVLQLIKDELGE